MHFPLVSGTLRPRQLVQSSQHGAQRGLELAPEGLRQGQPRVVSMFWIAAAVTVRFTAGMLPVMRPCDCGSFVSELPGALDVAKLVESGSC